MPAAATSVDASLEASLIPVNNPVREVCTDDTLSPTDYFNVPIARFAGASIELNGREVTPDGLYEWAQKHYKHKAERALHVQIAPDGMANANNALAPLSRLHPDLRLRRVEFGFTCPKLDR